jgi:hypothetical protein
MGSVRLETIPWRRIMAIEHRLGGHRVEAGMTVFSSCVCQILKFGLCHKPYQVIMLVGSELVFVFLRGFLVFFQIFHVQVAVASIQFSCISTWQEPAPAAGTLPSR